MSLTVLLLLLLAILGSLIVAFIMRSSWAFSLPILFMLVFLFWVIFFVP